MENKGILKSSPLRDYMAAISAGIVNNNIILDLDYEEDSNADVDMNVVMTASGDFIEIQATAERRPFNDRQMAGVISFAKKGIKQLVLKQKEALKN
jgi:ribonuclease PH